MGPVPMHFENGIENNPHPNNPARSCRQRSNRSFWRMCHEAPCKEWHCRGQGGDHFLLEKAVKLLLVVFGSSKVHEALSRFQARRDKVCCCSPCLKPAPAWSLKSCFRWIPLGPPPPPRSLTSINSCSHCTLVHIG